jgi:hypothetical protein
VETVEGWAFLLGPVAGVVLVPSAWALLNNAACPMPFRRATTLSALLLGGLIIAHWVVWWFSFDTYSGEPQPNGLFPVSTALMLASAFGCFAALTAASVAVVRSRRQATMQN